MDDLRNLKNIPVKQPYRIGIGQHQPSSVLTSRLFQRFKVNPAVRSRRNIHNRKAHHGCAGRIGSMGGVRHQNFGPLQIPAAFVISLDQQKSGKFAVGSGRRLKGHSIHAGHFAKQLFCFCQRRQRTLNRVDRLQRMDFGKSGKSRRFLIHFGVVFHGTGSKGIKPVVYPVGLFRKLCVMSARVGFRNLRQVKLPFPAVPLRQNNRHIALRKDRASAASFTPLKNQFHFPHASFTRETSSSISFRVFLSVTHHRIFDSPKGSPPR